MQEGQKRGLGVCVATLAFTHDEIVCWSIFYCPSKLPETWYLTRTGGLFKLADFEARSLGPDRVQFRPLVRICSEKHHTVDSLCRREHLVRQKARKVRGQGMLFLQYSVMGPDKVPTRTTSVPSRDSHKSPH